VRYPVSKTGGLRNALGVRLPLLPPRATGTVGAAARRSGCLRLRCDVVQTAGRPVVTRSMLVRAQPSQLSRPGLLAPHSAPLALGRVWGCGPVVSRVRRVRSPSRALLAVAQWTSTTLLPRPTGVRLLPARLRRRASSEPAGREPVEQGAIPWRRPTTTGRLGRRRSDTADMRGSIPRSSTPSGCGGAWPPRRFREPEIAGSTPAGQTCAVGERLSPRAS
jgi:hypothetical protein